MLALYSFLAVAAVASGVSPAAAQCGEGDCWGAIAYGPDEMRASAVNHVSRESAKREVERICDGRCERVLTFRNTCAAYAVGTEGLGWGSASSRQIAESRALSNCAQVTRECRVRVLACTRHRYRGGRP